MLYSRLKYNALVYGLSAGEAILFEHPSMLSYGREMWPAEALPYGKNMVYSDVQRMRQNRFISSLTNYVLLNGDLYMASRKVLATDELDEAIVKFHHHLCHEGSRKTWAKVNWYIDE